MYRIFVAAVVALLATSPPAFADDRVDLSEAVILRTSSKTVHLKATEMLRDEIEKRTRIGLPIVTGLPREDTAAIVVGTASELFQLPEGLELPRKADAYALWIDKSPAGGVRVSVAGFDDRGALYGVGRLLRLLDMGRDTLSLDASVKLSTAPEYPLRGHQFPYRPKTNTYDGWTVAMWEQYCRDMVVFGMNAIELMPPGRSDDDDDSPHFPKPQMEMAAALSQIGRRLRAGVVDLVAAAGETLEGAEAALAEREETFRTLPRSTPFSLLEEIPERHIPTS